MLSRTRHLVLLFVLSVTTVFAVPAFIPGADTAKAICCALGNYCEYNGMWHMRCAYGVICQFNKREHICIPPI